MASGPQLKRRRRALISVTDKTGLENVTAVLQSYDYQLVASGGTAAYLREHGHEVIDVGDLTGFPEIFGGRVKTLHPLVFGGILGAAEEDFAAVAELNVDPIDIVICNLYDFAGAVADGGDPAAIIEKIDIGGPSLLRAAAKNHSRVCVVCDPELYEELIFECNSNDGFPSADFRMRMAAATFALVTDYDAQIAEWFFRDEAQDLAVTLRYGENPHQAAEMILPAGEDEQNPLAGMGLSQLNGKELSYNNLVDTIAALKLSLDLDGICCVAMKHTNPCGVGTGATAVEALERALRCDPDSAFGGIFAFTTKLDLAAAEVLAGRFCEVILAPDFELDALARLQKKKNLRVLTYDGEIFAAVSEGMERNYGSLSLRQQEDAGFPELAEWKHVAGPAPDSDLKAGLAFLWKICKHVKSNAVVLGDKTATLGIGAGQMSRVDSTRIAVMKAGDQGIDLQGCSCASDAFFPFADSIEQLHAAGVKAVVAPGGSIRDEEVIAAAERLGVTLVHTNRRHFRH